MFHLAAVVSKKSGKYLFYKDYWGKYPDQDPLFKFFQAYIPFVTREKENTYKLVRWGQLRIAFGNFSGVIIILGATMDTSDKEIENYLVRAYEMLFAVYGDLEDPQILPEKLAEFARQLEAMIRVSATKEDLERLDHSVEERYGVTPASEEVNRRNALYSEQAAKVFEQFAVEMLEDSITKFRLFLTAAVRVKDAIHYDVIVDFSPYPHPPEFEFPRELHAILGDAGEALDTIRHWDPMNPPDWVDVIQELEEKVYRSETHLVEPIIEEPAPSRKKGGFAKTLQMPTKKSTKEVPSAKAPSSSPKGESLPPSPLTGAVDASPPSKAAPPFVPFQVAPPESLKKKKAKSERKASSCPMCGYIYTSEEEEKCPLCGSPRPK
ncbi:MAG: hypothetical protein ACTSRS_19875 [Candidatus Helarchaeota archaeon]